MCALRTIPVMEDFADDMAQVCPDALFLNYTNPMAMLDPHTASELDIDTIRKMVDELIEAPGDYLPKFN